jgi:hypothetical protein
MTLVMPDPWGRPLSVPLGTVRNYTLAWPEHTLHFRPASTLVDSQHRRGPCAEESPAAHGQIDLVSKPGCGSRTQDLTQRFSLTLPDLANHGISALKASVPLAPLHTPHAKGHPPLPQASLRFRIPGRYGWSRWSHARYHEWDVPGDPGPMTLGGRRLVVDIRVRHGFGVRVQDLLFQADVGTWTL